MIRKQTFLCIILIFFQISICFSENEHKYSPILINPDYKEIDFSEKENKPVLDKTCNINASTIKSGILKTENEILYICAEENGEVIYTKTNDKHFKTKEGLSIESSLIDFFRTYGTDIKFEVGTCMFLEISDGWRIYLSNDYTLDFSAPVKYFYKIDPRYSRSMSIEEYIKFMTES